MQLNTLSVEHRIVLLSITASMVNNDSVRTLSASGSTRNTRLPMMYGYVTVFDIPLPASEPNGLAQAIAVSERVSIQLFKQDSVRVIYETRKEVVALATFEQWFKGSSWN